MVDQGQPISYMALSVGTPVVSSSGTQFGVVEHVLVVDSLDIFDGIAVTTHRHDVRFVDQSQITDMTTTMVQCSFGDTAVPNLPAPHGTPVLRPDVAHTEGRSLTAWYGRRFGRPHWKDQD